MSQPLHDFIIKKDNLNKITVTRNIPEEGQEPAEEAVADVVDEVVAVEGSAGDSDEELEGEEEKVEILPKAKKLANQFNFCERAALTVSCPSRVKNSSHS